VQVKTFDQVSMGGERKTSFVESLNKLGEKYMGLGVFQRYGHISKADYGKK